MKHLVVLTGAGVSAESGLKTFRDSGGLWEGHDVMEVASIEGWQRNPETVLNFYNERRRKAAKAQPNEGHKMLAALEEFFKVTVITQNVDDLHERAGSTRVIHLHGQLNQMKSSVDDSILLPYDRDLKLGDLCPKGSQLRPNVVWFGEMVPAMEEAARVAAKAEIFAVIGTSLVVYPAAGLVRQAPYGIPMFFVDPSLPDINYRENMYRIEENASTGVVNMAEILRRDHL